MKLKDFQMKAEEIDEIKVVDFWADNIMYKIYAASSHDNVKQHAQSIIDKIVPTIKDCYHIKTNNRHYVVKKEIVDCFVNCIKKATNYQEMQKSLWTFQDTFHFNAEARILDHRIVHISLNFQRKWEEYIALRNILKGVCQQNNIEILDSYDFILRIVSADCDDKEECRIFCQEQIKIRKMDRIFELD